MSVHRAARDDERGNVLISVSIVLVAVAGFATALFYTTMSSGRATQRHVLESNMLYVAESALDRNTVLMAADPLYAVKDTAIFGADATAQEYVGVEQELMAEDGKRHRFALRVQYLNANTPVLFADRASPTESWDEIKVVASASLGSVTRQVVGWYDVQTAPAFSGAIISDMMPTGAGGNSKNAAMQGHVVFNPSAQTQYVFGDINANGELWIGGSLYTPAVAASQMGVFSSQVNQNLANTEQEIPNFTSAGSGTQLFDFDRFEAAAAAGAGQVFNTIADFEQACRDANSGVSAPLEGIIVLKIDSVAEGTDPKISTNGGSVGAGGINVEGTLVIRFSDGTDPTYKVFLDAPVNVNAADLSSWDPADENTYTSGYPGTFVDPNNRPQNVDISPAHDNFSASDDLPALMYENGTLDFHNAANVCGVVYGPSFIEIESKGTDTDIQYFNGMIIAGYGVYIEGDDVAPQAIRFDPNVTQSLAVSLGAGAGSQTLVMRGFSILR